MARFWRIDPTPDTLCGVIMGQRRGIDRAFAGLQNTAEANVRAARLLPLTTEAELGAYVRAEREALMERLLNPAKDSRTGRLIPAGGIALSREFSDLMDAALNRMFALACERSRVDSATFPAAIVATGGYGRRELAPYSDIDLTFIPLRDGDAATDRVIREMFRLVMEVFINGCGLEVGYAYRLLDDCGALDHQTACGLLDARLLAGSARLFIQFEYAYWIGFNPADFIFTKLKEQTQRHEKWGATPRVVEPNLKEGAGGLRDLHTAVWLTQARYQLAPSRVRGERAFAALAMEADVSPEDAAKLAAAKERLFQVRNALHAVAGRKRDELVVTRQEAVAALLCDPEAAGRDAPLIEVFMADLYERLALIHRVTRQVDRSIERSRLILGIGLDCKRRQIVPANDALISEDPSWLLWACELAQRYGLELSDELERAAVALIELNPVLPEAANAAPIFTAILSQIGSIAPILQQMAELGILGWYLPEFAPLLNLIPYDSSHDLTVGQHSLEVVANIERLLTQNSATDEEAAMRRVLIEMPHPEQLMLAALLHDAGKAIADRPHSETGEVMIQAVCRRLHWPEDATANVKFLVRQHLVMAETSRLRDLNLDATIRDFVKIVDDPERLNMLYLLTYADTKAVGAGVWTAVKGRFLSELWQRASAALGEDEPGSVDEAMLTRARRRLLKDLSLTNLPEAEVEEHLQAMPAYYLLNQSLDTIALHVEYVRRVRAGSPVVDFHEQKSASVTELTVCALDDPTPGLLAKIAGALFAADLNVHSAQVVTRVTERDRIALDTLWVDYKGRPLAAGKQQEAARMLTAVLTGAESVPQLLEKQASRCFSKTPPSSVLTPNSVQILAVYHEPADNLTVIELEIEEMRGAMYQITEAFAKLGWDIQSAKLSSWRSAARATFYTTGTAGLREEAARRALALVLP